MTLATRNGEATGAATRDVLAEITGAAAARNRLRRRERLERRIQAIEWSRRDLRIVGGDGSAVWEQTGVEFPDTWSDQAAQIAASKYFWGTLGTPERETSLRQVLDRVVGTVTGWATEQGYFADGGYDDSPDPHMESEFRSDLWGILVDQRAAFNSPVYFNLGTSDRAQQVSACFILPVADSLPDILDWIRTEGLIFRGGSGAGVNLSSIRGSMELLSGGGVASGPVSFMAGADASAGAIRSGGKTRRAAKMVLLDVDHPDIEEFVTCKAIKERRSRDLAAAGWDMSLNGDRGLRFQNANNSVRVSDAFMQAVAADVDHHLVARTTGETTQTLRARDLWRQIAEAAWECADPGVQYADTINRWHTCPESGPINGSNPCSEYLSLDNTACNLASINLLKFVEVDGTFDIEGFCDTVRTMIRAMDALVTPADYPTDEIGDRTRRYRQLGLGYANLGAALMALGLPYDSPEGRSWAAAVTALMTGTAYATSAGLAEELGPFEQYHKNSEAVQKVLEMHRAALDSIGFPAPTEIVVEARAQWDRAVKEAGLWGVRNAQVSVLAPTGTISFMLDCATTGVEPALGLVAYKTLVGGGTLKMVVGTVGRALSRLGYRPDDTAAIVEYIEGHGTAVGAPGLRPEHLAVFATAMGANRISPEGHLRMMAAVQPFLSGGISKTVNLDTDATVEDIEDLLMRGWELGLKAVAIYRDGSKVAQPMTTKVGDAAPAAAELLRERRELPRSRRSMTTAWRVGDLRGYLTVGQYDDGTPGEMFIQGTKEGTTLSGLLGAVAVAVSHGLQWGVPLETYVHAFKGMRFDPCGVTNDEDLRVATSVMDYLVRRMALDYLPEGKRQELGVLSASERAEQALPGLETAGVVSTTATVTADAPLCMSCGTRMVPAGSCHTCPGCGTTSGCS
ncbi:MAG: vitamin B12-dependent ribonucleotide reductase [bacterium]|nr:vitamin B12-dependent ribonucleotide reductase [bacterium]